MKRHTKFIHSGLTNNLSNTRSSGRTNKYRFGPPLHTRTSRGNQRFSSEEGSFSISEVSKAMKTMAEFNESIARSRASSIPNIEYLQRELNMRTSELSNLYSNYWPIHRNMIQGISGFFCKRCQIFGFDFVRDLGYDKTFEARHVCDELKVLSIHAVSIRKSIVENSDKFFAQVLLHHVQILMPGVKYLSCEDHSQLFHIYWSKFGYDAAKLMIGIPDRYCLYKLGESENLTWLVKVLKNPGKKTELKEDEVFDFLGKVKSSYAMFEIPTSNPPKLILLSLTT